MTDAEKLTNTETMRHILTVRSLLADCASELLRLGRIHDASKLGPPELEAFTEFTPRLAQVTYGSDEYRECMDAMRPAIEHHYKMNPHHPEYHEDGILGMDLFDLLEMLCDWKAAGLRHSDGDLRRSLEINTKRHEIPEALAQVLRNTLATIDLMSSQAALAKSYPHVEIPLKSGQPKADTEA